MRWSIDIICKSELKAIEYKYTSGMEGSNMTAQFGDLYHYGGNDFTIICRKPCDGFEPGKFGLQPDKTYCSA